MHQQIKVLKETNSISIDNDPHCCKITIKRVDRIGDITVGHIPRELSRFAFHFVLEAGSVTETATNITTRLSPIPEEVLEISILMNFVHKNNAILNKMKTFVIKKIHQMHDKLDFDQVIEDVGAEEEDEEIEVQSDDEEESVIENHKIMEESAIENHSIG